MTVQQHKVSSTSDPITLTQNAIKHVRNQIKKRGSGIGMRLAIEKRGCSGLAYVPSYVDKAQEKDIIFEISEDIAVFIDPLSYAVLKGTQVDYVREGLNERFVYINPNESGSCGCGESFTVSQP